MQIDEVKEGFTEVMINLIKDKASLYDDFIFGMIIATAIWLIYHRFVGLRSIKKSYEGRLNAKDETISTLKIAIYDRLDRIEVSDVDRGFWSKFKKIFKIK